MLDNPKEKHSRPDELKSKIDGSRSFPKFSEIRRLLNVENTLQILGISLQILMGLGVVTLSVLGLIRPLWMSALMSIFGSASVMIGIYQFYYLIIKDHTFESLISRAIRRVIRFKN